MKKKISIVIGLALLFCAGISCESEDQINSLKPTDPAVSIDKNAVIDLQETTLSPKEITQESCDDPREIIVYAGQDIDIGKLYISNNEHELFITYDLSGSNWWLQETHLFAGDIDDAPFTNSGNPQIGKFPYHGKHELTQVYTFTLPLSDFDEQISLIAHAAVVEKSNGSEVSDETAFGFGDIEFPGSRWGWIINYRQQTCSNEGNTGSNSQTDTDNTQTDTDNENGCMDGFVYASAKNSICLLREFDTWGWSNKVPDNELHHGPGGTDYTFPLYASAFQCDINNSMLIGELQLHIAGGDGRLYADIQIDISHENLNITDLDLYVGSGPFPIDIEGNPTLSKNYFDISLLGLNDKTYAIQAIEWGLESYFIAHVKVCPDPALP